MDDTDYGVLATVTTKQNLTVCQCDAVGECVNDQLMSKQDEMFLCVWSVEGLKIDDVQALTFHQDDKSFSTIVDGISDDFTWVVKERNSCLIRTRLDKDFFKPSFRGTKRTSVRVEGTVGLQDDVVANFELAIPLQTSRLTSYVSRHGLIIAFFVLLLLLIAAWALFVTMASISRTRPESLSPEKLREIEERRLMEIYTIWYQSQWSKTSPTQGTDEHSDRTLSASWSDSSSSEEEKVEIEPYEVEGGTVLSNPSVYAANIA